MKRVTLDLGKVSKGLSLKFGLIMDSDDSRFSGKYGLVGIYKSGNNEYMTLRPHPFLKLEISGGGRERKEYNPDLSVTLNNRNKMLFENLVYMAIDKSRRYNIFEVGTDYEPVINKNLIKQCTSFAYINDTYIVFEPALIPVDNVNSDKKQMGFILFFGDRSNYTYLTIEDLDYLYYVLKDVNMILLSTHMLSLLHSRYGLFNREAVELRCDSNYNSRYANTNYSLIETSEAEMITPRRPANIVKPNTIPEMVRY